MHIFAEMTGDTSRLIDLGFRPVDEWRRYKVTNQTKYNWSWLSTGTVFSSSTTT